METNRHNGLINFQLGNFKSFSETANFPIRPITLLFGPNSAGKSSFIKALLMLKQSEIYCDEQWLHGELFPTGKIIELGNYKDIIYNHDTNNELFFSISLKPDLFLYSGMKDDRCYFLEKDDITKADEDNIKLLNIINHYNSIRFAMSFRHDDSNGKIALSSFDLYLGDEELPLLKRQCFLENTLSEIEYEYNFNHSFWKLYWETFNDEQHNNELIRGAEYYLNNRLEKDSPLFHSLMETLKTIEPSYITFENTMELLKFIINNTYLYRAGGISRFMEDCYPFSELQKSYYSLLEGEERTADTSPHIIIMLILDYFSKLIRNVDHIGPLRNPPERYYRINKIENSDNSIINLLLKSQRQSRDFIKEINYELNKMKIPYMIKLQDKSDHEKGFMNYWSIELVDTKTGTHTNFSDVGFGISQILPIIFKCCLYRTRIEDAELPELLCIEQPELHLHPATQAEIGDLLIKTALWKKSHEEVPDDFIISQCKYPVSQPNTIEEWKVGAVERTIGAGSYLPKLVIETHSEHLILRILRRIRETSEGTNTDTPPIYPEDVAVLYVKPGENGSEVFHIPVTADGDFECEWPDGFFEERDKELFSL